MHSWWKTQDFRKIESGPNYKTAAHAFVKATLRLGLRAPSVARKKQLLKWIYLETVKSDLKEQVKTVDCELAQIKTYMVQIWNYFYYSGNYVLSHKTLCSQIIYVYTDKSVMLKM